MTKITDIKFKQQLAAITDLEKYCQDCEQKHDLSRKLRLQTAKLSTNSRHAMFVVLRELNTLLRQIQRLKLAIDAYRSSVERDQHIETQLRKDDDAVRNY